jgi:4-amino-4-deoxy-L-arabinose transferase-like glycosyltransferase
MAKNRLLFPAILAVIAAARLIHLDADPGLVKSLLNNAADAADEAYWSFGARNLILFGTLVTDDYFQTATSPFYTVISYMAYWLFGVSMYTTRLPNAILGVGAVVLAYRLLEPYSRPAALLAGVTLALENNFFIHTRMGQVEATCGFFALLSFYLLIRSRAAVWAGVALGLSVASKIVALLLVPAFGLFFLLQWVRGATRPREVLKFFLGLAVVGGPLLVFVFYYYVLFVKNVLSVQSQGVALLRQPARAMIDFVTGYYLSYPSIGLLVVLLGAYAWRARVALWVGRGARARLRRITDVEIMVVAWLGGYAAAMLLLSDVHHRRMNLFTIPLALVPGLLVLRGEEEPAEEAPRGVQVALLCAPIVLAGALISRRAMEAVIKLGAGRSLMIALVIMVVATAVLVTLARRWSRVWWERVGWVALMACVALASISLAYSLVVRILPNLEVTARAPKVGVVIAYLTAMVVLGILARRNANVVVAAMLLLSVALDAHDIVGSSFSARDASLQLRAMTTSSDWVVGDGAHALSLNTLYHPVQAYPVRGVNADFVARMKPRYLFRETDHRDEANRGDRFAGWSIREDDLYAAGASKIEAIADFPLYPVLRMPGELTYRLYRVTY